MMSSRVQKRQFGLLLTKAIRTISINEEKNISVIQDDIGYSLRKKNGERYNGGASIEYWRKGNLPPDYETILELTRFLVERRGFSQEECQQFLQTAGIHGEAEFLATLFATSSISASTSSDIDVEEGQTEELNEPGLSSEQAVVTEKTVTEKVVSLRIPWNRQVFLILVAILVCSSFLVIFALYLYRSSIQSSSPVPGPAQTYVLSAVHIERPPTIDGDIDEPVWQEVDPRIFAEHPSQNGSSTARIRLLWDETYLYAAFDVDDTQVEDAGDSPWDGDSVSLILNSDYIEHEPTSAEFRHSLRGTDAVDRRGDFISYHMLKERTSFNNPSDEDTGYTVEMQIPWVKLPSTGLLINVDMLSVDHDGNPGGTFDDRNTTFSKIFWDSDDTVDEGQGYLILNAIPGS
ncbi:MAG: sugar-binding protein [Caldilineaceae bacterium]